MRTFVITSKLDGKTLASDTDSFAVAARLYQRAVGQLYQSNFNWSIKMERMRPVRTTVIEDSSQQKQPIPMVIPYVDLY